MKITIMRDQLIAALCTAGKQDIRPYLNGVYLEATNTETRITSSDGSTLALQRADAKDDNQVDGVIRMIVPRSVLEKIKNHKVLRTVEINDDGGKWGIVDFDTRTNFEPVDGRFPDFLRIVPRTTNGNAAQFQPALIANFAKAAVVLGASAKGIPNVGISHNGTDAALVSLGRDAEYIGVLMPMRPNAVQTTDTAPSWALSLLDVIEELA